MLISMVFSDMVAISEPDRWNYAAPIGEQGEEHIRIEKNIMVGSRPASVAADGGRQLASDINRYVAKRVHRWTMIGSMLLLVLACVIAGIRRAHCRGD
jgi:hypothetical protein